MGIRWAVVAFLPVVAAACSDGDGGSRASPSATNTTISATTAPTVAPDLSPTLPPAVPAARALKAGPPVALPPGVVVYSRDGVWEGAGGSLRRWYTGPGGSLVIDEILVSRSGEDPFALTTAVVSDSGRIWAAMCRGVCYGSPEPVTILTSVDSGITWTEVDPFGAARWSAPIGASGEELVVRLEDALARITSGGATRPLQPASGISWRAHVFATPTNGELLLAVADEDRRIISNLETGEVLGEVPVSHNLMLGSFLPGTAGAVLQVSWTGPGEPLESERYFGLLELASSRFQALYRWHLADGLADLHVTGWISETVAVGRVSFDASSSIPGEFRGLPAIIDFERGIASPIADFIGGLKTRSGGPSPFHVDVGPVARVVTGDDCLNVRSAPGTSGGVLGCFANGVLLGLREEAASPDGRDWLAVRTPDGREGWAAAEYLEIP